jgi:hypothetical protein
MRPSATTSGEHHPTPSCGGRGAASKQAAVRAPSGGRSGKGGRRRGLPQRADEGSKRRGLPQRIGDGEWRGLP